MMHTAHWSGWQRRAAGPNRHSQPPTHPPKPLHNPTPPTPPHSAGGKVQGLCLPTRVFPCATPSEVRSTLPPNTDVVAFQCRNPIHRAHYELFIRALDAPNVRPSGVVLVHPTVGPTQVRLVVRVVRLVLLVQWLGVSRGCR